MKKLKRSLGITLVALVISIIVLLILAGVTIGLTMGENGLLNRTELAKEEDRKQTAIQTMQLKITSIQMENYTEKQRLPTLQEIADGLCEDNEMEYVLLKSNTEIASLDKITVGEAKSIFTKIKQYPYEFEINSSLQLASIDGVKIAKETVDKQEYDKLVQEVQTLKDNMEYKTGDKIKFSHNTTVPGMITNVKKELNATITLGKNISKDVKSIKFTGGYFNVRHSDGKYLIFPEYQTTKGIGEYFKVNNFNGNVINLIHTASTTFDVTNNTPITVTMSDTVIEFE